MLKVTHEDRGISVFLPPKTTPSFRAMKPNSQPMTLPLTMENDPPPFPEDPRAFAIRLFQRYSFAIGDSPSRFIMLTIPPVSQRYLDLVKQERDIAFLCINDDIPDHEVVLKEVSDIYRDYLRTEFPDAMDCEAW